MQIQAFKCTNFIQYKRLFQSKHGDTIKTRLQSMQVVKTVCLCIANTIYLHGSLFTAEQPGEDGLKYNNQYGYYKLFTS